MSILIKSMELPTRCADCPFEYDSIICRATGNEFIERSAAEGGYVDFCDTRMPDCPLIEISPVIVDPVVHGRWIFHDDKPRGFNTECSVCHAEGMLDGYYCPNCGAKMDLVI